MIKYSDGTVFNSGALSLVNTVNTVGVMGAGLALEFSLRYPNMFLDYQKKCSEKILTVGRVDYYIENEYTIVNFPTKWHFKYPSKLEWIEQGLQNFVNSYKSQNITSVAFPRLGCANGGLNWRLVQPLMERYLGPLDIDVYICLDTIPYAEGKEKQMVDAFNNTNIGELSKQIKLSKSQQDAINSLQPIERFWKLSKVKGIGIKTYTNIFNYFYNYKGPECEQLSLF